MNLKLRWKVTKAHAVLAIRQGQIQKPKSQARGKGKQRGKGKSKLAYDPKHKIPPPAKKEHPAKDTECIFTIELFSFPKSNSWIYDTGCGTHICNTIQGLRGYQKLNKGALDLYVGNGNTAAVEAIGSYELILPSGMILVLDNFSKDNIFYFNAFPRDGIFEIDMHNHISNEPKEIWDRVKLLIKGTELSLQERESKLYNKFDRFTSVEDSGLAVPSFLPGNDPIASLNKAMAFISTSISSCYPTTKNQLRTSSNLRNQATIQDGRGEGHMAIQCTQPKKTRNSEWFKEKMLLVQAQELGIMLDEEQHAFLVDP
ncbi:hypothetical protein Tco_1115382 [Tanacetum coccineum]